MTNDVQPPIRAHSRRLVFVNRFYSPDLSATSQMLTDVAEALSKRGNRVFVFSSRMTYQGETIGIHKEELNGVQVHRIWCSRFGRGSTFGRAIDYLTFYLSITVALLFFLSRSDILIAKTDPPVLSIPLGLVARIKRAKMVNWLQDLFPEVAQRLGYGSSDNQLMKLLKFLRNRSLKRARMNVTIGGGMAALLRSFGVADDRICIIQNFTDDVSISRSEQHSPELRKKWGISDEDFVVGYSGNLGRAHDLETILHAAELLKGSTEIKFVFIGGGFQTEKLVREIATRKLANVILKPYQARSQLNQSLALPNLHWASLVPELEGLIVPSKIYGIAAAGRPLLMIGAPDGEIGGLLSEVAFGKCISIGDSEQVKEFILSAKNDAQKTELMGRLARTFIDQSASRQNSIERWERMIMRVASEA